MSADIAAAASAPETSAAASAAATSTASLSTASLGAPFSRTNHPVHRTASGWIKAWTPGDDVRAEALRRENRVNRHLGVPSMLGPDGLLAPRLGESPTATTPQLVVAALDAIERLPGAPDGLRGPLEWEQDQLGFVLRRLPEGPERDACLAHAPDAASRPDSAALRGRLVHADPHLGSMVLSDGGELRLIDWEAALDASQPVALACLAHYLVVDSSAGMAGTYLHALRGRLMAQPRSTGRCASGRHRG